MAKKTINSKRLEKLLKKKPEELKKWDAYHKRNGNNAQSDSTKLSGDRR